LLVGNSKAGIKIHWNAVMTTQPPSNLLEQAHQGNTQAISHLINRSLQRQGVTASVELNHGLLEVIP